METKPGLVSTMAFFFLVAIFLLFSPSLVVGQNSFKSTMKEGAESRLETYIVFVQQPKNAVPTNSQDQESWYRSFLPDSTEGENEDRMVYSYENVLNGFAARLSKEEVESMKEKDGFVSAQPDILLPLLTTRTPSFLGLRTDTGLWKDSNLGKGVIVALLDTGILPNHVSFNDEGMPPPPSKWKGTCEFNGSAGCNKKLIGARTFISGSNAIIGAAAEEPIDEEGHGTHTASTAAGRFVENVNVLGNAKGTAVGMAPLAYLAMYKVCTEAGCASSDLLKGLDTAVGDGADVISLSIGGVSLPFHLDTIAIGSFGAIQKGIFVSCAGGNSGPFNSSLSNEAPWILTVGASTIDRKILATAKLGNGEELNGESLFQPIRFSTFLPLVYPGANGNFDMATCTEGSLNQTDLSGKVVLCDRGGETGRIAKGIVVKNAGGAAMILVNQEQDGFSTLADAHVLPATHLSFADGVKIKAYLNSSSSPTATILFKGTLLGTTPSPTVASFSSRGPSLASPGILKPDIIGPGVSILAAWPFPLQPSDSPTRSFNMISGTSMATPHLSGIAALLKGSHPDWSPAAIKSAIMTTAHLVDTRGKPILDETLHPANLFAIGAGHVNPSRANDPGLVYDLEPEGYIPYLCGLGYTDKQVQAIIRSPVTCSSYSGISEGELNYPSFSADLGPSQTFTRTVTNVGEAKSSYTVQILKPQGVDVVVQPEKLSFSAINQKLTFSVTISRTGSSVPSPFGQGYLMWVSSKNSVGSPISVTFK